MFGAGRRASLLFAVVTAVAFGAEPRKSVTGKRSTAANSPQAAAEPTLARIERDCARLRSLFEKLPKPEPGDWLAEHKEPGQRFDSFRRTHPDRQSRAERTIYVQPLGEFPAAAEPLVAATCDLLGHWYDARVERLPIAESEIPAAARRANPYTGQPQILTTFVLDKLLIPRRPSDATAVLALSATDLWPGEGWNFVFGQASLRDRVGVWSLARFGDPAAGEESLRLCLRRMLKVAMHETGHMFGFEHCTAYRCGMNGSNSRDEMDRAPLVFCPECEAKIWWACECDPHKRLRSLEEFAGEHRLADEAAVWKRERESLER